MSLSTYLTFDGNCREAFEFYRSVFGGEYQVFTTFGEGPDDMGVGDDEKDRVMHVSLPVGDCVLMGSDSSPHFGAAASGRQQLLDLGRGGEPGAGRRAPRRAVGGRRGGDADGGDVLGLLLRDVHRPFRHQLDGVARTGTGPIDPGRT